MVSLDDNVAVQQKEGNATSATVVMQELDSHNTQGTHLQGTVAQKAVTRNTNETSDSSRTTSTTSGANVDSSGADETVASNDVVEKNDNRRKANDNQPAQAAQVVQAAESIQQQIQQQPCRQQLMHNRRRFLLSMFDRKCTDEDRRKFEIKYTIYSSKYTYLCGLDDEKKTDDKSENSSQSDLQRKGFDEKPANEVTGTDTADTTTGQSSITRTTSNRIADSVNQPLPKLPENLSTYSRDELLHIAAFISCTKIVLSDEAKKLQKRPRKENAVTKSIDQARKGEACVNESINKNTESGTSSSPTAGDTTSPKFSPKTRRRNSGSIDLDNLNKPLFQLELRDQNFLDKQLIRCVSSGYLPPPSWHEASTDAKQEALEIALCNGDLFIVDAMQPESGYFRDMIEAVQIDVKSATRLLERILESCNLGETFEAVIKSKKLKMLPSGKSSPTQKAAKEPATDDFVFQKQKKKGKHSVSGQNKSKHGLNNSAGNPFRKSGKVQKDGKRLRTLEDVMETVTWCISKGADITTILKIHHPLVEKMIAVLGVLREYREELLELLFCCEDDLVKLGGDDEVTVSGGKRKRSSDVLVENKPQTFDEVFIKPEGDDTAELDKDKTTTAKKPTKNAMRKIQMLVLIALEAIGNIGADTIPILSGNKSTDIKSINPKTAAEKEAQLAFDKKFKKISMYLDMSELESITVAPVYIDIDETNTQNQFGTGDRFGNNSSSSTGRRRRSSQSSNPNINPLGIFPENLHDDDAGDDLSPGGWYANFLRTFSGENGSSSGQSHSIESDNVESDDNNTEDEENDDSRLPTVVNLNPIEEKKSYKQSEINNLLQQQCAKTLASICRGDSRRLRELVDSEDTTFSKKPLAIFAITEMVKRRNVVNEEGPGELLDQNSRIQQNDSAIVPAVPRLEAIDENTTAALSPSAAAALIAAAAAPFDAGSAETFPTSPTSPEKQPQKPQQPTSKEQNNADALWLLTHLDTFLQLPVLEAYSSFSSLLPGEVLYGLVEVYEEVVEAGVKDLILDILRKQIKFEQAVLFENPEAVDVSIENIVGEEIWREIME